MYNHTGSVILPTYKKRRWSSYSFKATDLNIGAQFKKPAIFHLTINQRVCINKIYSIYIPCPFPPVWGVADNAKKTTKTMGVTLRSSSNNEGPSRDWMAMLEQHSPSSPVFHNLRHFIDAISPTAPTTRLPP